MGVPFILLAMLHAHLNLCFDKFHSLRRLRGCIVASSLQESTSSFPNVPHFPNFLQAVLLVSLSIAAAAVSGQRYNPRPAFRSAGPFIPIVSDRRTGPLNGAYDFAFETGNGIRRNERGTPSGPRGTVVSRGDWRWGKLN